MNFEGRHEEWVRFIQSQSENLSQSMVRPDTCKVCTCLELLKLSLCPEHAHIVGKEDFELLISRLLGQVATDERENLAFELGKHENYLGMVERLYDQLSSLLKKTTEYEQQMKALGTDRDAIQRALEARPDGDQFSDLIQVISKLESRVESYEVALSELKAKNQGLREQLQSATSTFEAAKNTSHLLSATIKTEFSSIKEEYVKIKLSCESLTKRLAETTASMSQVREERSGEEEVESTLAKLRKDNLSFLEEQRRSQETSQVLVNTIFSRVDEMSRELSSTSAQVEKLGLEQQDLKARQEECKTMSRHSSNLLSAADSVYSQHQELKDFQERMNQCMEEMKRDIENLKNQRQDLGENPEGLRRQGSDGRGLKKESVEEFYHPGTFMYVDSVGRRCWSCCQTTQDAKGCQRRFK